MPNSSAHPVHIPRTLHPRRARAGRRALRAGLALIALLCAVAMLAYVQSLREPAWWAGAERSLAAGGSGDAGETAGSMGQDAAAGGRRLEERVVEELYRVRGAGREAWSISLPAWAVNAWLAKRLRPWARARGVGGEIPQGEVRAAFMDGHLALGVREGGRVLWVFARPAVDEGERLVLREGMLYAGRLPVRPLREEELAGEPLGLDGRAGGESFAHRHAEGGLELGDGRRVVVERVRAREGFLDLWMRTEK